MLALWDLLVKSLECAEPPLGADGGGFFFSCNSRSTLDKFICVVLLFLRGGLREVSKSHFVVLEIHVVLLASKSHVLSRLTE